MNLGLFLLGVVLGALFTWTIICSLPVTVHLNGAIVPDSEITASDPQMRCEVGTMRALISNEVVVRCVP